MRRAILPAICLSLCGPALWGAPGVTIGPGSLPNGTVGAAYSQTLTASGGYGAGTYTFSVATGTLPPGITLSAAGVVSGTPTTTGIYDFTAQATSISSFSGPITGTQQYTIAVYTLPAFTPQTISPGMVGLSYSVTLTGTGGYGAGGYSFSVVSGTLPNGIALSTGGVLSGTPTAAGTFGFTVKITSVFTGGYNAPPPPLTANQSFSLVIYPVLTITTTATNPGSVGVAYSQTFTATGGAGASTYTWSVASGTPPPGLTLSAAGVLSGIPTAAGGYPVTIRVSSPIPTLGTATANAAFTIAIATTTTFAITGSLPGGTLGAPYSATLGATGGYGPGSYTFSLASGTLPPGLKLLTAGTLSGTPTATGTSTFTVQVTSTNSNPNASYPPLTATQSFTVVIYPVLAISTGTANSGTVGAAYSQTFTATGGAGASSYAWSVATGTLPPGLALSAAGVLSGIPTAAGNYTVTLQVSSVLPATGTVTATAAFTVTITTLPALAITGTLPGDVVGTPYSATLGATGGYGAGTYAFSLSSGTLPSGLKLSAGGILAGTPTAAGTSTFTVQVTSTNSNATASFPPLIATQPFTVVIYPVLALTPQVVGAGVVATPYTATLAATGGYGTGTYIFSLASGALPPGLKLSSGGTISGTPTATGTATFSVQVTSSSAGLPALTATQSFTIAIYPALALTPSTLNPGMVGANYSVGFAPTGGYGSGSYSYTLTSGTLPSGISLVNGILSGTPTAAGTFTFTVQVANSPVVDTLNPVTLTATQSFTLMIYPALAFTPSTLNPGTVGTQWAQGFNPTGGYGVGTYSYTLASGTLPPGITLNPMLSGTPTAAGTFTFAIQLADGPVVTGQGLPTFTVTQSYTLVIYPALAIAPQTLSPATLGSAYSATLSGTGGYGPGTYSFSLASGALPSGVTLSAGGVVSGTPTAAGPFPFTAQITSTVTGVNAILPTETATQSFTLNVAPSAAPRVTISGLPASPAPDTQPVLGLTVGSAYPLAIQGAITLTFAPGNGADDPNVQFTTGGRSVAFAIPAGSTQAQFPGSAPGVQTGTVAGAITLTLDLKAAGIDITPTPAPTQIMVVPAGPPVITSATVTRVSGGFNLVVGGYATTRDMTSAAIVFTPAAGVTLSSNTATVPLSPAFTTWYQSSASAQYGSQFSLGIPFTVSSTAAPIASLSITLTNSQGSSPATTAVY